ncbi:MAG: hypothetical protein LC113_01625 [Acidobacteria bacterium]|nr:hypothetical protein [Acidobacteriota bacterium]
MKRNRFTIAAILALLLVVLGCGRLNPLSSKETPTSSKETPTSSKPQNGSAPEASPATTSSATSGVAECDEAIDIIDRETNSKDDNFVTRAAKAVVLGQIKEGIKKAIEDSKAQGNSNTQDLAKVCREFRDELEKQLAADKQKAN